MTTELALGEWSVDLRLPPPRVPDGLRVHRFVGTAVGLAIRLIVSGEVDASGRDSAADRRFPDGAFRWPAVVLELAWTPDADGKNLPSGSLHRFAPFRESCLTCRLFGSDFDLKYEGR